MRAILTEKLMRQLRYADPANTFLIGAATPSVDLSVTRARVERPILRQRGPERIGLRGGVRERRARPQVA
jgi:hypothetical protein